MLELYFSILKWSIFKQIFFASRRIKGRRFSSSNSYDQEGEYWISGHRYGCVTVVQADASFSCFCIQDKIFLVFF